MFIKHPLGYLVDPQAGHLIGAKGVPIRKRSKGYVIAQAGGRSWVAHRLIWEAVHGPIPGGVQINHKNGIKHDNRIANLELVTPSGNMKHAYATGLCSADGECNGRAKLSGNDVARIRVLRIAKSTSDIARAFGVSYWTIRDILSGRNWSRT